MGFKLNWNVQRKEDGSFVRKHLQGDAFFLDHIDVEWTHANGFPGDTERIPITHPPNIKYVDRICGQREKILDSITISPFVSDSTVAIMLDEKRITLAKSLGIDP